jgi:predicted amidohydrolase
MIATATGGHTLQQFAESLMPGWRFPEDWLAWPPDTFALTSAVLGRTGAYRHVISAPASQDVKWQGQAEKAAIAWAGQVSRNLSVREPEEALPSPDSTILQEVVGRISELAPRVSLDDLRTLDDNQQAQRFAEALLQLHAIADEACTGFGVLGSMRATSALAHCLANLLLTAKGSLSRLPKHAGIVLPKLRTPQQGLTLRSLSHHVTYHVTEVEVMWRAMPWPNVEENTINILAVPWPPEVRTLHFQPREDTFQPVRYFSYRPAEDTTLPLPTDRITALVKQIEEAHCRIHLVVFPESSLTVPEYLDLLAALKEARQSGSISRVPMVLAGVHRENGSEDFNEVRLAAYFAQRWYELSQRKHHRWRLDRNQIRQYGLEGRLATARGWYENITLGQRRLTFLAPNGWLALSPLICEDLAQLEPVSELIRGVGPTLLVSLLADGPQIPQRWSARYASVFADDPGTAVLTLSSLGMVSKSKKLEPGLQTDELNRTVALWKDHVMGWQAIELPKNCDAVMLTISSDLCEEFTADGRGDHQSAATFKFEGVRGFELPPSASGEGKPGGREKSGIVVSWDDMRELSAAMFAINTLLHLRRTEDLEIVLDWLLASPDADKKPMRDENLRTLVTQMLAAQSDPRRVGILADQKNEWPTPSLRLAVKGIRSFFADRDRNDPEFWMSLVNEAIARLEKHARVAGDAMDVERRVERVIAYSVLTCAHSLLESMRRRRTRGHGAAAQPDSGTSGPTSTREAAALFRKVEAALDTYSE